MSDSIRPYQNYTGGLVPQAVLNGTINTIVYASNYNDLDNKPSINSVELRGNKTASDLGLATPEDITVTSVNTQTGDVSLTGQNIPYDSALSVTEKINDLESQIVDSGVSSVNGYTGVVSLTGNEIPYIIGKSVNTKINEVESSIPIVDYPVTSVNTKTGAVVLSGSDIEYSAGVSISTQIDNVAGDISDLTGADIPLTSEDSTKVSEAIGTLSTLTTTDKSSLVGAVNEVVTGLDTDITFTLKSGAKFTVGSFVGKKAGIVNILNLKLTPTEATTIGTEIEVGNFANIFTYGSGTYYTGVIVDDQTKLVGSYLMTLGNQKLYLKFTDSTTRAIDLTLVVFSA